MQIKINSSLYKVQEKNTIKTRNRKKRMQANIKIYKYTKNTVVLSGLEFYIETNLKHKQNELHASLKTNKKDHGKNNKKNHYYTT